METTRERWTALYRRLYPKNGSELGITIDNSYDKVISAYSGPDRHYHNLNHINDGLVELDKVRKLASSPDALELAWWWHDFVCEPGSRINEQSSAEAGDQVSSKLEIDIIVRISVIQMIMATKHDYPRNNIDASLIIDIDLASLAASPEVFDENTAKIRKEYPNVSDEEFKQGRADFFKNFLETRETIYITYHFREKYEAKAQANLKRFISTAV